MIGAVRLVVVIVGFALFSSLSVEKDVAEDEATVLVGEGNIADDEPRLDDDDRRLDASSPNKIESAIPVPALVLEGENSIDESLVADVIEEPLVVELPETKFPALTDP